MFGSLILPTPLTTTRSGGVGGGGIQRDHLSSSIPNNYHPTMSFPSRHYKLPRTRKSIRPSFTTTTAAAASSSDTTLPSVELLLLSFKPNINLYQILRIKQNASSLEIKTAYRKLAKQFHPDALPPPSSTASSSSDDDVDGGARDFMAIHNAYATLSDPTERARYDLSIQNQIHTRRFHSRYYSSSSSSYTAVDGNEDRRRSYGMQTTTRWETDQCW